MPYKTLVFPGPKETLNLINSLIILKECGQHGISGSAMRTGDRESCRPQSLMPRPFGSFIT